MKKKFLALCLVVVLAATAVVSGSMAYLQDEDSDVNVMTLGNVQIEQHEYQRATNDDGAYKTDTIDNRNSYVLEAFEQGKALLPAIIPNGGTVGGVTWDYDDIPVRMSQVDSHGGANVFNTPNAVDKFVTVENTGKSDAYVRTLIALEVGTATLLDDNFPNQPLISTEIRAAKADVNTNGDQPWTYGYEDYVEIDGNKYLVYELIYTGAMTSSGWKHENGVLPAGATTYPSLCQVYMASRATNEDVEAIDGNNNGTYDIFVLSQAVQTAGFADAETALDTAFGDVTAATAAEWLGNLAIPEGYQVNNSEELADAVAAGETKIWLNPGTYTAPAAAQGKTLTINGTKDAILEVVPGGQGEANGQLDYSFDGSTVTFNGITIKTNSQLYAGYARLSGTYNDCVIQNTYNLGTGKSAFYNCEINITNEYLRVGGASSAVFDGCTFNTDGRAILVFQDGTSVAQTVTVKDCTFNATAAANTWNGIHVAAVSYDGSLGGTYTVKFEGTNTVDSDFNGLWQIKAGEANVTVSGLS